VRWINEASRAAMTEILEDIRSGGFTRRWVSESNNGFTGFENMRCEQREHLVEEVGARLRSRMAWMEGDA
jgi:ketol-acid reductoisomerase